jgi:hypothetical protein
MTSVPAVILATGMFLFLWSTLKRYVERHGPLSFAPRTTRLNSQLYSVFSLGLAGLFVNDVFDFCGEASSTTGGVESRLYTLSSADLAYVYHLSKFYEYVDVFNLVVGGHPIGPHMAFHHLTTPVLTYFRVPNASDWQPFAFFNCFHHFWMYAYFGGASWFRRVLPVTGWLQLVVGIGVDAYRLVTAEGGREDPGVFSGAVSILLLTRYAMLFQEELRRGSQQKKTNRNSEKDGTTRVA